MLIFDHWLTDDGKAREHCSRALFLARYSVSPDLTDRVAGAGLSEAKEAPEFPAKPSSEWNSEFWNS